ncbi:hypothetical protein Mapa_006770 [Marchantia paleacea]|nr:hypothetical protein Mapa_006770 [Marchantia paleacea]
MIVTVGHPDSSSCCCQWAVVPRLDGPTYLYLLTIMHRTSMRVSMWELFEMIISATLTLSKAVLW